MTFRCQSPPPVQAELRAQNILSHLRPGLTSLRPSFPKELCGHIFEWLTEREITEGFRISKGVTLGIKQNAKVLFRLASKKAQKVLIPKQIDVDIRNWQLTVIVRQNIQASELVQHRDIVDQIHVVGIIQVDDASALLNALCSSKKLKKLLLSQTILSKNQPLPSCKTIYHRVEGHEDTVAPPIPIDTILGVGHLSRLRHFQETLSTAQESKEEPLHHFKKLPDLDQTEILKNIWKAKGWGTSREVEPDFGLNFFKENPHHEAVIAALLERIAAVTSRELLL